MTIQFFKKKRQVVWGYFFFSLDWYRLERYRWGDRRVMEDVGVLLFFRVCGGWMKNKEKER
jgi:hypothetical protein